MAKSKEQKRTEAKERNALSYMRHHMPELSRRLPGGEYWLLCGDHLYSSKDAVKALAHMTRICNEMGITLTGSKSYDTFMSWAPEQQFDFLLHGNNLNDLREGMARTYNMRFGTMDDAFMVDESKTRAAIRDLKQHITATVGKIKA
ncbi:hypothetical protein AVT69_gp334 [Pseudomonas phage PhiPA3]|uniref:Uncharacterized protein 336 n=1 Tax=Pseudomonas phage PhiPA3 TaxID=998086 RepID=F8SJH2_BPPA3|nr:hypothetical protein AVT69_gp334 [Pseudomonas phage PhiPA3]AEH03759.1 hypothetical protein [Pseudomonas phage PhiPA3]